MVDGEIATIAWVNLTTFRSSLPVWFYWRIGLYLVYFNQICFSNIHLREAVIYVLAEFVR